MLALSAEERILDVDATLSFAAGVGFVALKSKAVSHVG